MKKINLLRNSAEIQAELSVIHFSGEKPESISTVTEIYFVARGNLSVFTQSGTITESEEDIFLINKDEKYSLFSDGCVVVSLKLEPSLFITHEKIFFECDSASSIEKNKYYNIIHLLARLVKISADTSQRTEYLTRSFINLLIHELYSTFVSTKKTSAQSKKYLDRLNMLTDYINTNFRLNLSLRDIADYAHLSVPYLSTFFDKYFGMSFLTYYTNVRLRHAVSDLMSSDE